MKTKFLIILFCCCCCVCVAQEAIRQDSVQSKKNSFRHWQIGASFSPDALVDFEKGGKFSFTTGLHAVYKVTNYLGIETGVFFSNKSFTFTEDEWGVPIWYYKFLYIDVPIRVNYYFGKGKRGLVTGGAAVNFRQYYSINTKQKYSNVSEDLFVDNANKVKFSALVGVGVECKLSDRFILRAIPIFRLGLKESLKSTYNNYSYIIHNNNLWYLGAEIGIFYEIK